MYFSDLTDAQWALLEPLLRAAARRRHAGGRPRKYRLRRVVNTLRRTGRLAQGRKSDPSLAVLDSQSVKTALKGGRGATTRARRSRVASATSRLTRKAIC